MTKITYTLAALLVFAVFGCVILAYLWIDRSISLSYARQSIDIANNSALNFRRLLEEDWRGQSEAEILQKLQKVADRQQTTKPIIKKEADSIWFNEERFNFRQGRLSTIGNSKGAN